MINGSNESQFAVDFELHRRELHVHCYRMLGSFEEAEDVVQEAFARAWARRETFTPGSNLRAWLYRIATNACLDAIRRSKRRVPSMHSFAEVPWLQPYPDRLLDELDPNTMVVARESIALAFIAMIQLLSPKQRAVLLLRDVVGWSAGETAVLLEMTVASANSALQRARATLQQARAVGRTETRALQLSERERELLSAFIETHERGNAERALALVREDIRVTMPPLPWCFDGREALAPLMRQAFGPDSSGEWRLVPIRANRMPAALSYLRAPQDTEFRAFKIDVLRVEGDLIAEITTFDARLDVHPRLAFMLAQFGLPPTM